MLPIHVIDRDPLATKRAKIKICGIMQPEHALTSAQYGADMVGVVFAESRRKVSIEAARAIRHALDSSATRPALVGVFVNASPACVRQTVLSTGLDAVQLCGDESLDMILDCMQYVPVIRALRFPKGTPPEEALATLEIYAPYTLSGRLRLLVDAHHPLEYGGTGQMADWSLAAYLAKRHDIILAGGLNPANVHDAVKQVSPSGIDVSSGVERDGTKDPQLIRQFIEAARCT